MTNVEAIETLAAKLHALAESLRRTATASADRDTAGDFACFSCDADALAQRLVRSARSGSPVSE